MNPSDVLAAAREHAEAEGLLDIDRTLATFVADPVFEFYPSRLTLRGWDLIERFYREHYANFAAKGRGGELLGEWSNEDTAIQEYRVDVEGEDGLETYRVISMSPVVEGGKLAGERLYCDEGFVRHLLGDLFDACEPIEP